MILWLKLVTCQDFDHSGTCSDVSLDPVGLLYCASGCCFSWCRYSHRIHFWACSCPTCDASVVRYAHCHGSCAGASLVQNGSAGVQAAGRFSTVLESPQLALVLDTSLRSASPCVRQTSLSPACPRPLRSCGIGHVTLLGTRLHATVQPLSANASSPHRAIKTSVSRERRSIF